MNAPTSIACPVCGEPISDNVRECPNCGTVLSSGSSGQPIEKTELRKKTLHPWYSAAKQARQSSLEKSIEKRLKTVGKSLDGGDFDGSLKAYQTARKNVSQLKHARLFTSMFDLLEKSTGILVSQKKELVSTPKHQPAPVKRASSPSLAGRLVRFSVLILAGIGLLGLFGLLPAWLNASVPPTQTKDIAPTETLPTVAPTLTPATIPLPDPIPIFNNNIDKIQELYRWPAGEDIESLSFSPDGKLIASGDSAGKIKIWQLWTDQPIFELSGTHSAFSPDGKWIGVAGSGGLGLYDASDGSLVRSFDKDHSYFSVLFSPDSQLIVGGSNNGKFYIWSVNDGAEQKAGGSLSGPIHSLSFSQDGNLLAAASNGNSYVWNLQKQKIERGIDFSEQPVYYSTATDADGEWYAMGHEDGQMYIWRISNGERMAVFNDKSRFVHGLQFFHGTKFPEILVSGDEVNLSFWIMAGYETSLRRSIYTSTPILSLSIAPKNDLIATGGKDGVIHLWGVVP